MNSNVHNSSPPEGTYSIQETCLSPSVQVAEPGATAPSNAFSGALFSRQQYESRESPRQYGAADAGNAPGQGALWDPPSPDKSPPSRTRLLAPDLLRGLLMMFMALDHNIFAVHPWLQGMGRVAEADGQIIESWNYPVAIFARALSHLCAPGFAFLLGMGVLLFARSRSRWSRDRLARHLAVRAAVLTAVSVAFGFATTGGRIWFLNPVLVALAVDYFLVGMLGLGIERLGPVLDGMVPGKSSPTNRESHNQGLEESAPLLGNRPPPPFRPRTQPPNTPSKPEEVAPLTRHLGTAVLAGLAIVTMLWNEWFSPTHGRCPTSPPPHPNPDSQPSDFLRFWFYPVERRRVMSAFPPLAWISPAILGFLYARLVYARGHPLSSRAVAGINVAVGVVFAVVFVLTRLLHFGNLGEDCLRIGGVSPADNQYLESAPSFFYTIKYPPDLAFFSFTLSANFFILGLFGVLPDDFSRRWLKPLIAFGQSALFFYVAHFFVLMSIGSVFVALFGRGTDFKDPFTGQPAPGVGVWGYLGNWALSMAVMWPICRLYGKFKRTKGPDSIWRFF